jgi:hypothetical protein
MTLIMLLPEHCSLRINGDICQLPPSYIVSVNSQSEEYMIAVVCDSHMKKMENRLHVMQLEGSVPEGNIKFQPLKMVTTNCIKGIDEDYIEIE